MEWMEWMEAENDGAASNELHLSEAHCESKFPQNDSFPSRLSSFSKRQLRRLEIQTLLPWNWTTQDFVLEASNS